MNPVHKSTMLAKIRRTKEWEGYIAPSKAHPSHITGGWHLGIPITIRFEHDKYVVLAYSGEPIPLELYINSFSSFNCNSELGRRVRFWQAADISE